jgi:hypothetical protein
MSHVPSPQKLLGLAFLFGSWVMAGCSALGLPEADKWMWTESATAAAAGAPDKRPTADVPSYVVEFRPAGAPPERLEVPMPDTTFIQDALQRSRAQKRFSRFQIQLYRPLPDGGQHRIDIAYDRGSRRVPPAFDYALRQGDRLIFVEDTSNILDDMLANVSGPLGRMLPGF